MSITFDWSSGNRQAYEEYKPYPEDDEELKQQAGKLVQRCVDAREGGDYNSMPFLEAGAYLQELRIRGYEVSVDTSSDTAILEYQKP